MSRIIYFLAILGFACAATFRGYMPSKPKDLAHKEGCYVKQINDVLPFGTQFAPIGECMRIECENSMLYYATCGIMNTDDPKCYVTDTDLSRPYPDCCPDVRCEIDNNLV
ncbi:uncharacterized protein ACR2FA_005734 [Aphomia sociella]